VQPESALVEHLVRQIVVAVRPLRVVLFGSAARGEMGPESDLDLLVVMPDGTHRRKTAQLLYRTLDGRGTPFDVVVATPSDIEKHQDAVGLIYRDVIREGREVYASGPDPCERAGRVGRAIGSDKATERGLRAC